MAAWSSWSVAAHAKMSLVESIVSDSVAPGGEVIHCCISASSSLQSEGDGELDGLEPDLLVFSLFF